MATAIAKPAHLFFTALMAPLRALNAALDAHKEVPHWTDYLHDARD